MAKRKTEIHVTTVFDGELNATDVFVDLIVQQHMRKTNKEHLVKAQKIGYNKDDIQSNHIPSGLCG